MNTRPVPQAAADSREALLSAMADGEADALERGCELWRSDAHARATWHAYHLIGDVMRSDDLASTPGRDAAFLSALRTRLADEPVVLAPTPAPRRRQRWLVPTAAAAGFVAVAGVMVVARMADAPAGAPMVAAGSPVAGEAIPVAQRQATLPPATLRIDEGKLIRDPRLDAYLEAHGQAYGTRAVAVPGGAPRYAGAAAPASAVQVSR